MTLDERLAEIEKRCDAATPNLHRNGACIAGVQPDRRGDAEEFLVGTFGNEEDAEFHANARDDVRALLKAFKVLRESVVCVGCTCGATAKCWRCVALSAAAEAMEGE